jgi:hypothetical protein
MYNRAEKRLSQWDMAALGSYAGGLRIEPADGGLGRPGACGRAPATSRSLGPNPSHRREIHPMSTLTTTTEVVSITLKREAFEKWRTGYSSALAIILFVTVFGAANIYVKALNAVKNR